MNGLLKQITDYVYQNGLEKNYYTVVALSDGESGELYRRESIDFRPGNAGHDSYSVSKSVTAIAAGILIDRGLLSPSDKIKKWLGEYLIAGTDPKWGELTVHDVMCHRTGAAEGIDLDLSFAETWADKEWLHTLFACPLTKTPGADFVYSDGSYYIVGRIIEKIAGMDLDSFLQKELFTPLAFHQNAWSRDVNGHTLGGTGLYMRTEDMAKIGWLCLNNGCYGNQRIYSPAWAKALRGNANDETMHYGYGIPCLSNGGFAACGMYGQGYYLNPQTHHVVAWHSFGTDGLADLLNEIDR